MKRVAFWCVVLMSASVFAQGEPDPQPPPAPAPPPPAPGFGPPPPAGGPSSVAPTQPAIALDEQGLQADANQDHAWYLPTGETVPKGAVVFTDWELMFAGLKYGAADNVELSAETLVPITTDIPIFVILGGKIRVIKTGNVRVALNANILYAADQSNTSDSFTLGMIGGAASLCLDAECHSLLTGGVQAAFGLNTNDSSGAFVFVPSASLIGRLGKHVKALIEIDGAGDHYNGKTDLANGALVMYGLRFNSSDIAGDIGFARPVCSDCDTGGLVLGIPLVTFSYRF